MVYKRGIDTVMVPPSSAQMEHIRKEINEEDDNKLQHNEHLLITWIECQPHFPKNYDKYFVRSFLRNSKHILERAKRKLEHHFIVRNLYPEYFTNRSPRSKDLAKAADTVDVLVNTKLTDTGRRLIFCKLEDPDPSNFDVPAAFKWFFMLYDFLLTDPNPVAGEVAIIDGEHFNPNHLVKFVSPALKPLITILREAYVLRLKQIHIVNSTPFLDKLWMVIKPLLHTKVRNSIITHDTHKSLVDYFGADVLPSNYGGKCKSLREMMNDWKTILNDNEKWFIEQESVKITEKNIRKRKEYALLPRRTWCRRQL
ncbi:hypothetical protein NQ318_002044 [Aromia moschata]|uniref:CRAL-TRIO domain-containing protein n=1 Tax=Aromia moschata TaxID=1265417 RepID=A0AAV8Z3W1_9CUCU|nr:hypothetical protein NQ318_002044 [Aromia moschata]